MEEAILFCTNDQYSFDNSNKLIIELTMKKLLLILSVAIIYIFNISNVFACNKLKVRQASEYMFGISFPYWFNYAQLQVESNCRWVTSLDGLGSVGYGQMVKSVWDKKLKEAGFYNWTIKDHFDHFLSQVYILKKLHNQNPCKKLYITYQSYNRSINKVVQENKQCDWKKGYEECIEYNDKPICVWRSGDECLQWRQSCDISYEYPIKIYKKGISLQEWITKDWIYW